MVWIGPTKWINVDVRNSWKPTINESYALWLYGHFLSRTLISQFFIQLDKWVGRPPQIFTKYFFVEMRSFQNTNFLLMWWFRCSIYSVIVINHFMLADDRSLSMISRDENRMRALIESIKKETKQKRERPKECPNLLQRAGQVGNNSTWCKSSSSDCMVYMISN